MKENTTSVDFTLRKRVYTFSKTLKQQK